jgi:hypothetical protein
MQIRSFHFQSLFDSDTLVYIPRTRHTVHCNGAACVSHVEILIDPDIPSVQHVALCACQLHGIAHVMMHDGIVPYEASEHKVLGHPARREALRGARGVGVQGAPSHARGEMGVCIRQPRQPIHEDAGGGACGRAR